MEKMNFIIEKKDVQDTVNKITKETLKQKIKEVVRMTLDSPEYHEKISAMVRDGLTDDALQIISNTIIEKLLSDNKIQNENN